MSSNNIFRVSYYLYEKGICDSDSVLDPWIDDVTKLYPTISWSWADQLSCICALISVLINCFLSWLVCWKLLLTSLIAIVCASSSSDLRLNRWPRHNLNFQSHFWEFLNHHSFRILHLVYIDLFRHHLQYCNLLDIDHDQEHKFHHRCFLQDLLGILVLIQVCIWPDMYQVSSYNLGQNLDLLLVYCPVIEDNRLHYRIHFHVLLWSCARKYNIRHE